MIECPKHLSSPFNFFEFRLLEFVSDVVLRVSNLCHSGKKSIYGSTLFKDYVCGC